MTCPAAMIQVGLAILRATMGGYHYSENTRFKFCGSVPLSAL
ncbi:hypothetical protein BN439_2987 [Erwinia amylovora Ea644]|nr:hypothetical protein BN439_2987 [Erwinia amylovora Ea644]CCP08084.1 hypothetical protein BN440_3079 [Erwinia amylovora MR1]